MPGVKPPEAAPLCPWREPDLDLKSFFPEAKSYQAETRILSGVRSELASRLGRWPTGDENALRLNRVYQDGTAVGAILTRRVKGEYGGIELVLATDDHHNVRGLRLQRLREPEASAEALQDQNWLNAFVGKRSGDPWHVGGDIPEVPASVRGSALAIVDGVRSLLILLEAADQQGPKLAEAHHH